MNKNPLGFGATVPCEFCSKLTPHTDTKQCNSCWELERVIRRQPDIARKILDNLKKEPAYDPTHA